VDRIHFGVAELSDDVGAMGATMANIDLDLGAMAADIGDLRQSSAVMEVNVGLMGRDMNHLSSPARIINQLQTLTGTIDGMDHSVALMPVIRDQMDAIGG